MEELPQDWLALAAVVLLLGLKHGFDADHLAAIDGMTRFNAAQRPRLARLCGVLFSLGHGAVVVAVALGVSFAASQWQTPEWPEATGSWISIAFLLALGLLNLDAVLRTAPGEVVRPAGLRGRWIGRLAQAPHPALVALVGALFALSFDTISQAALFSLTATRFGGWEHALALGLLFTLGMLVMDGVNGWWISRLLARADRRAVLGSRIGGEPAGGGPGHCQAAQPCHRHLERWQGIAVRLRRHRPGAGQLRPGVPAQTERPGPAGGRGLISPARQFRSSDSS